MTITAQMRERYLNYLGTRLLHSVVIKLVLISPLVVRNPPANAHQ